MGSSSDHQEARQRATELLGRIDNVMVDHEAFAWPWQPFRTPCDQELEDRERRAILRELANERDSGRRLGLALRLVHLGGYEVEGGDLEASPSKFHLYDQFEPVSKFMPLDEFVNPFCRLPKQPSGEPDWEDLGRRLVRHAVVRAAELSDLDLVQLRRCVVELAGIDDLEDQGPDHPGGPDHGFPAIGSNNGSAVYGVWVRILRPGQPDQALYRTKVEFPYRYIMGTPVDPANPDGRITPVFVQAGDQIQITANTYRAPILHRFNELALDQPTLSYKWEVRFGVVNDDILLTNTSQVPLTNVVFRPRIESNGQRPSTQT